MISGTGNAHGSRAGTGKGTGTEQAPKRSLRAHFSSLLRLEDRAQARRDLVRAPGAVDRSLDAAIGAATLLVTYSDNDQGVGAGQGLDLDTAAADGAISKAPAQVWSGTAVASGTATFWRYVQSTDTGAATTTELRMQGTVGGAGADLFVQSTAFTSTTLYSLDYFSVTIPL